MGEFDPVKRWVDKLERAITDESSQRRVVREMGAAGKAAAIQSAVASVGGDRRMSNLRGGTLGADFDAGFAGGGSVRFEGAWRLAEEGRRSSGRIYPRRRQAVLTPRGPRAWSSYRRSRGLRTYSHAVAVSRVTVPRAGHEQMLDEIRRAI